MLIDTHCHLNSAEHYPDPDSVIESAKAAGIERLIIVGTDPQDGIRAVEIAERHEGVYAIAGFHPNYCAEYSKDRLGELEVLLAHPKVVALGEIGLDYHWEYTSVDVQMVALHDQLDLARAVGKPVVFHCREAYADLLTVLEARPPQPYLIHCFAGTMDDARRAVALDCLFGIDGPITYKKNHELRAIAKEVGLERLVLETDSPYLTPEPFRGKPNNPAYVRYVNDALALALGVEKEVVEQQTTANAIRFFGLK